MMTQQSKTYVGQKVIKAWPMNREKYNEYRGWKLPEDEEGSDEGYLVEYLDGGQSNHELHEGYVSWSPRLVFEEAYREADGLPFGIAVEALKRGQRVTRKGWNGKGMFLWLLQPIAVKREWVKDPGLLEAMGEDESIDALGSIRMFTADRKILTGWLASQTDVLAEDWLII